MCCLPASWRLFIGNTEDTHGAIGKVVQCYVETQTESQFYQILTLNSTGVACLPSHPPMHREYRFRDPPKAWKSKDWESERNRTVETLQVAHHSQKFANEDSTFLSKLCIFDVYRMICLITCESGKKY